MNNLLNEVRTEFGMLKFSSRTRAMKDTGLSYLGSVNSSSKIAKGAKYGIDTYILYLAPADMSGFNVCPNASIECKEACLVNAGRVKMDRLNIINSARVKKTQLFYGNRAFFNSWLFAEIDVAREKAIAKGHKFAVRLNGTSDITPELFTVNGVSVLAAFPDVTFYDYTKIPNRYRLTEKYGN